MNDFKMLREKVHSDEEVYFIFVSCAKLYALSIKYDLRIRTVSSV